MNWRNPETAPRDGTRIKGLFERHGKRAIALVAVYDTEMAEPILIEGTPPQWSVTAAEKHNKEIEENPLAFFRPEDEEDDNGDIGQMIGWRP